MLAEGRLVAGGHLRLQAQAANQLPFELRQLLPLLPVGRDEARSQSPLGLHPRKLVHERLEPGRQGLDILRTHTAHALPGETVVEVGEDLVGEIAQLPRAELSSGPSGRRQDCTNQR